MPSGDIIEESTSMHGDGGWAKSARGYINFMDRGDPNRELLLDPVMLELCGAADGVTVLDIGCGEGRFCRRLAQQGTLVLGIDPTHELIHEARRRDASQG